MTKITKISNWLKNKFTFVPKLFGSGILGSANFHWRIILVIFFLAALTVSMQSFWAYRNIGLEKISSEENLSTASGETVTNDTIDKVINRFDKRADLFNKVQGGYFYTSDPAK